MRKYRKFDEGGLTYGEDERPAPTGMSDAAELVTSGGEDVVAESGQKSKLRRNLETGELYSSDEAITRASPKAKPKAAVKPTPAVAKPTPAASSTDIPTGSPYKAPASTGEDTSGPSDIDRVLLGLGVGGAGVAGAAKLMQMRRAKQAADAAREAAETTRQAAARFSSPQARQATTETGRRFSPKAEMEAAESTVRGAAGRKDIQAKRALEESKGRAKAIEKNKPVMQASPKKASPRSRTRDEESEYELRARGGKIGYASGGSVRGWGQARGARKAQNY